SLGGGGSAASGKNEAPVEKASFDSVRRVLAAIPRPLADRLEKEWPQGLPTDITEAISRVIVDEQRTAEQAADRIARRWLAFGYDDDANSQDGRGIDAPLGMLLELLSPSKCWANDARCEDGLNIDSGVVCARCEDEREDRRRAQESAQDGPSGHPVAEAPATAETPTYTAPAYVPMAREDGKSYGVNVDLAREARQAVLDSKSRVRR
ncbi:hypothetical protein ACFVWR_18380, partial [Leifsonia sp. NPDC058292]|uniref:hypothetical protein n=1 Tax=Leifsonia sp. NPDC058292 TaxID=3346428 RepID=UPI0036DF0B8B